MHPVTECLIWHKIPFVICEEIVSLKQKERVMYNKIYANLEYNLKVYITRFVIEDFGRKGFLLAEGMDLIHLLYVIFNLYLL